MLLKSLFLFAFLTIQVSCEEKGSLAFIIDNTGSSMNIINGVKSAVKMMPDIVLTQTSAKIQDMVLVTFNDPEVSLRTRTYNTKAFRKELYAIVARGGDDCPEMSLSGIKKGLEESRPGSYLYVFTDASAKDYAKFEEVKVLCQAKKSQITFILTGTCEVSNPKMNEVYNDLAVACGGGVLRMSMNDIDIAQMYDYVKNYMDVAKNVITSKKLSPFEWTKTSFTKDASTDYILVAASGTDVQLQVAGYEGKVTKSITGHKNFKILKLADLPNGEVSVKARSASSGHVAVYGHVTTTDNETDDLLTRY